MQYFQNLLDLLKLEKEEDFSSYRKLTESATTSSRRAAGLSWYPIAIKGSESGRGDYLTVEVERPTHQDVAHQLRFGASAELFSNHDAKNYRIEGIITHSVGNKLKITLKTDELPDWTRDGKLGINLLFDSNSYDEMAMALKKAMALSENPTGNRLVKVLTGESVPEFETADILNVLPETSSLKELNEVQILAVKKILSARDLAIVHGPPGTGKTTTLVHAIYAMLRKDNQPILVVAPSNIAVDLLSEKLADLGLTVLRVGNPARVNERLLDLTLDGRMNKHPSIKEIKKLKKQAAEFKTMAHKYKRSFGRAEQEQRKALFSEAHKILDEVSRTEQYIIDDLINKAEVITATLAGSNHYTVRELKFHTVVIDEAGQALEPACWIPILKAEKVILAGDHKQLSPTIKSEKAARSGLRITLMEKCVFSHPQSVILLEEQYRMNLEIMGFSSKTFYDDRLKANFSVEKQRMFEGDDPFLFIDTAGCGFNEQLEGTSTANAEEAGFLIGLLNVYVKKLEAHYKHEHFPEIGIISPYKQQVIALKESLDKDLGFMSIRNNIMVNTIDSFQGQEKDIILISMVRSNPNGTIGFLADIRRMNVALTRAKKKMIIVGDGSTLGNHSFYLGLIAYAEKMSAYKSAWEYFKSN